MRQVVLRNGEIVVADVAAPSPARGRVLVANAASVISSGTERATVSASTGSLPVRAIRNPGLVFKTLQHARKHGIRETVDLVRGAVADDSVLGYSTAGTVIDTGGVAVFEVGQAVACAGAGWANHAEIVSVPANLVSVVPNGVGLREAAFTTLGAIAMQGVRRADTALGERIVVVGLGLLGLMTVQILSAGGCQVIGVEPVEGRRKLAGELGAQKAVSPTEAANEVKEWTEGFGADAAIITASGTSDAIINDAILMLRRKGRVIPVGDIGLRLKRPVLYQREADVLISTSYGPGRYDPTYELDGIDYPISYVRWTENRNMDEFLRLLATEQVRVEPLIELEVPVERAKEAYAAIGGDDPPLSTVLTYDGGRVPEVASKPEVVRVSGSGGRVGSRKEAVAVAVVGAGSFVRGMHIPNLRGDSRARIKLVIARRGTTAANVARSIGGAKTATDWKVAVEDPDIDLVFIGTRHDTHAEIAKAALRQGKAVFVEKPLGLTREEIDDVWTEGKGNNRLAIGFNRPFAQLAARMAEEVSEASGPIHLIYRVNAPLTHDHWLNDPKQGGGRILGEACHMFDFANWLCGTPEYLYAAALPAPAEMSTSESTSVIIRHKEGSVSNVHYSGVGGLSMPKERIEVMRGGNSWILDDFQVLVTYRPSGERTEKAGGQDKGHAALLAGVIAACMGNQPFKPGLSAAYMAQSVGLAVIDSIASAKEVPVLAPDTAHESREAALK